MSSYNGEDNTDVSPGASPSVSQGNTVSGTGADAEMTTGQPEKADTPEAGESFQPEQELETEERAGRPNFLTATRFADFELPPEIVEGIDNAGFEYCTPIQAQAIPVAMSGEDIAGQAQTGTGKTTAFLVPLLDRLLKNKPLEPGVPRALIVTPTRELALQIHEDALILAGSTNLRQVLVIGGMDYKEQADLLATAPEIIICTPGRIIDYIQQGVFKTKGIEVAVVDEADRLLDMGFIKDLKYLLGKLPPFTQRQTMLFSATLDDRVLELTYQFMNPPQFITAEPDKNTRVNIEQELYHVGRDEKLQLLLGLLRRESHRRIIIFSNTKSGVEWLAKKLTMNGFQAEGITGDLPQPKRLKMMEAFKENRLQILVATDVASRGIHVDDVSHVYNYDLPQDAENYVHRIGRTARAGHEGKAVSFGCEDYVFHLEAIENLLGEKIPVYWAEPEMFQDDLGGEVRLKDRRPGGDRKRVSAGGRGGGKEGGSSPRPSRGPAKSQRPGGIFGLAPRSDTEGADVRHTLGWTPNGEEVPVVVEGEFVELPTPETEDASEDQARDGRRRKRRRGRRSRPGEAGNESVAKPEAAVSEPPVEVSAKASDAAISEAGEKEQKSKRPAREKSRYPRKRVSDNWAAESETRSEESLAKADSATPAASPAIVTPVSVTEAEEASAPKEAQAAEEKAPAPKKVRATSRKAPAKKTVAAGTAVSVDGPPPAMKAAEAEKPRRATRADKTDKTPAKGNKRAEKAQSAVEKSVTESVAKPLPKVAAAAKKPKANAAPKKVAEKTAETSASKPADKKTKAAAPKAASASVDRKKNASTEISGESQKKPRTSAKKVEPAVSAAVLQSAVTKTADAKAKKDTAKPETTAAKVKKTVAKAAPKEAKKPARKPAVKKETNGG